MPPPNLPPPPSDALGEVLHQLRLSGTLYCQTELSAPWGIDVPALEGCSSLALVTAGRVHLEVDGAEPRWLERGSVALVVDSRPHRLRDGADTPCAALDTLPVEPVTERYERLRWGGGGEVSRITYGVVRFEHPTAQRLLQQLPPVVVVDPWDEDIGAWLQSTAQLATREAGELRPGGETVITRLADILVIQAIRRWLDTAPEAREGWLAALRDDRLGRALSVIHANPAHPWTVAALAHTAGMSRSAFAARFTELVGQPALQYLTDWRMQLAHADLRQTRVPLIDLAERYGYGSEAAFSKAFKRRFGVPPGRVRAPTH